MGLLVFTLGVDPPAATASYPPPISFPFPLPLPLPLPLAHPTRTRNALILSYSILFYPILSSPCPCLCPCPCVYTPVPLTVHTTYLVCMFVFEESLPLNQYQGSTHTLAHSLPSSLTYLVPVYSYCKLPPTSKFLPTNYDNYDIHQNSFPSKWPDLRLDLDLQQTKPAPAPAPAPAADRNKNKNKTDNNTTRHDTTVKD